MERDGSNSFVMDSWDHDGSKMARWIHGVVLDHSIVMDPWYTVMHEWDRDVSMGP